MKKILIWSLILVLAAVVSVVGTLAYLTATDEVTNVMVVDDARIEIREYQREDIEKENEAAEVEKFENDKLLIPSVVPSGFNYGNLNYNTTPSDNYVNWNKADEDGDIIKADDLTPIWDPAKITNEIDKMVFVKNTGDCNVYVRLCFAFEAGNYVRLDRFKEMVHLNLNTTDWDWEWVEPEEDHISVIDDTRCFLAWATYKHVLPAGEHTNISLSQIALDFSALNDHAHAFGDTYDVKVFAQGIQSDGFATANAALSNGFDDTIPFKNVKEVNFIDLYTALHYLNGENSSANKITSKVTNVIFGLTEKYKDEVAGREGVLVANKESGVDNNGNVTTPEADFTAYAYYVPNGENYDIYILADDWKIYAPNNSGSLFDTMKLLVKVDTSNLDVSYVTNMSKMFHDCLALAEIDVSHWVVDNVTNMAYMFQVCQALTELDCSNWDVSNVTNMDSIFHRCNNLKTLDASNWDVSKVTNMHYMFSQDGNLENLNISGWHFGDDDTVQVDNMASMFNGCSKLEYIDVANWNVSKVTNMSGTFVGCNALKSLDVSRWNVGNVTTMDQMFYYCYNLASLDVSEWNVSNVDTMGKMFQNASKLTELDLSNWNTKNVSDSSSMFNHCVNLKTIYVGDGWTVANVTSSAEMFKNCQNLEGGNGTTFSESNPTDKTYAIIDGGTSNPGYLTKK